MSRIAWSGDSVVNVALLRERRSSQPIDRLSREFDSLCTEAVDAHQIAASLEARGINDRVAQDRYSAGDVFVLAAELHHRVPVRSNGGDSETNTAQGRTTPAWALIMRGPIYLVPGLFFVGGGDVLRSNGALWVVLISLLLAWVWNQGFGVFIHLLIGRGEPARARRAARQSLVMGTSLVTLLAWSVAHLAFGNGWLSLLVLIQTAYLIASAALLALSKDRLLLAALAPGAAVAVSSLITAAVGERLVLIAAVATAAAVVTAMAWATRNPSAEPFVIMSRDDGKIACVHALLGGAWAMLIALAGYAATPDSALLTTVSVVAAPMVMTMGVAEWQLVQLRRRARHQLATTREPADFARSARGTLMAALLIYAASILAVTAVVVLVARLTGNLDVNQFRLAVAFVFLGGAMFAGIVLVSMGRAGFTLGSAALIFAATGFSIAVAKAVPTDPAIVYGTGCLALFSMLAFASLDSAAQPVVYR